MADSMTLRDCTPPPKARKSTFLILLSLIRATRRRDQLPKRPVMQSHGITLSFHREMADSSRELVAPDVIAAVSFESYPRFIKRSFQDYEGLGIERIHCRFQACSLPTIEVARKQRLLEPPPESSRIFGINWNGSLSCQREREPPKRFGAVPCSVSNGPPSPSRTRTPAY